MPAEGGGKQRVEGSGDRTGRQGLLKLVGLLVVLENQGVQLGAASDLELGLRRLLVLLYPRRCIQSTVSLGSRCRLVGRGGWKAIGSLLLFFVGASKIRRTLGILAAADLDELDGQRGQHEK